MIKLFFTCILLIPCSLFAGMKTLEVLDQYEIPASQQEKIFMQHPELYFLDIADTAYEVNEEKSMITLFSDNSNAVYNIEKSDLGFKVEQTFVVYELRPTTIEGKVEDSLYQAIVQDTASAKVAYQVSNAFINDFKTARGIKTAVRYSLEVTAYYLDGRFVKYGDVLKAKVVVGRAMKEKILKQDLETLLWTLVANTDDKTFYAPVRSSRVSSLFQFNRLHPVKKRYQPHNGIDFVAPSGTPVYPALPGVVVSMGRTHAKGKFILIAHDNGFQTTYDHLRKFQKGLSIGKSVELNDQIGEVGRTGFATGAHLHFGVMIDGLYVNPLNLLKEYTFDQKEFFETADLE